ncbi:sugar phosphate isomerase/epimerase [Clostridium thermarum]|uniref:sugar phosphate isomerase/epimerase n=1 Tax=Clostridium thermarum TaxID=1716543 RepID=UPI00112199BD|nr:sugar phosphate isomerase/epimerase [Clostridium thermarum]
MDILSIIIAVIIGSFLSAYLCSKTNIISSLKNKLNINSKYLKIVKLIKFMIFVLVFVGIEACLLETNEDIESLIKESKNNSFKIGVHYPLRSGISELRDPQFLSLNEEKRQGAFKLIEDELKFLTRIKPEYVLFHYPKPVILDEVVDWSNWRFADSSEYIFEAQYSFEFFREKSEELFKWLTQKSLEYDFVPVLELDALNKYIYKSDFLEYLFDKYPKVKLCLDTGRLHLQDQLDKNFNAVDIIERFATYAEVIHLWNVRVRDNLEKSHHPVLPHLRTEEGWAPIEQYLKIIKRKNSNFKVMFEHRSDWISDEELNQCYRWVKELLTL